MFETLYAPHQHTYTLRTGWVLERWLTIVSGANNDIPGFRMRSVIALTRIPFENTMSDYFDVFMPKSLFVSELANKFYTPRGKPIPMFGDWTSV